MATDAAHRAHESTDRTVRGVIAVIERDKRWLMIQRADGLKAAGAWCFPGGAIQRGETQESALVRETREEVGLTIRPIRRVWEWSNETGLLHLKWWATELVTGEVRPNPAEVADFRWVFPADLPDLPNILPNNLEFAAFARSAGLCD